MFMGYWLLVIVDELRQHTLPTTHYPLTTNHYPLPTTHYPTP